MAGAVKSALEVEFAIAVVIVHAHQVTKCGMVAVFDSAEQMNFGIAEATVADEVTNIGYLGVSALSCAASQVKFGLIETAPVAAYQDTKCGVTAAFDSAEQMSVEIAAVLVSANQATKR